MNKRFLVPFGVASVILAASITDFTGRVAKAAEETGPGGTYECWDRCRYGVSCLTTCYEDGDQITCNQYHYSCSGVGGTVGQGCGDGICSFDAYFGFENYSNCPTDCGTGTCVPSWGWDDVLYNTHCCSGQAVPGSIQCADPADYNNGWESCFQRCQ